MGSYLLYEPNPGAQPLDVYFTNIHSVDEETAF
jgi:hypothetical protein